VDPNPILIPKIGYFTPQTLLANKIVSSVVDALPWADAEEYIFFTYIICVILPSENLLVVILGSAVHCGLAL
jgi:hypothetical protein